MSAAHMVHIHPITTRVPTPPLRALVPQAAVPSFFIEADVTEPELPPTLSVPAPSQGQLLRAAEELTPRRIVAALDQHIVGQAQAKRMVAIALRNRIRRRRLSPEMAAEIMPKNILLIGPTGVGKTEIARRLAGLVGAPFIKVEATKYTEVGYVGRDVESMVRDLVDNAVSLVRQDRAAQLKAQAEVRAEERLLDVLIRPRPGANSRTTSVFPEGPRVVPGPGFIMRDPSTMSGPEALFAGATPPPATAEESGEGSTSTDRSGSSYDCSREKIRQKLRAGELEQSTVELAVTVSPTLGMVGGGTMEDMGMDMRGMLEKMLPKQSVRRTLTVAEARQQLVSEALEEMMDEDAIAREALTRSAEDGIIFIDEIDKIAGGRGSDRSAGGPDVSREGVQRDILPIVEGSTVRTKYGLIQTDHILFIAAGSFSQARPSDLIPELQGRFPLRAELRDLNVEDFQRILTEPRNSLCSQYRELLATDGVDLSFTPDAIAEIARAAFDINSRVENIGARRLHTLLERVLEDVAFAAPDDAGGPVTINAAEVRRRLGDLFASEDLSRFVL